VVAPASLAVRLALEDMVLLMVEELGLMGSWAPQGWSCRQEDEQALSPLQPVTHWLPHSWQMKKGIVWVYWVTFGRRPSPHSQEKLRVSGSQELSFVVKVSEGGCRQISCGRRVLVGCCCSNAGGSVLQRLTGHCVIWLLHQTALVLSGTVSGLMEYCSCAEASDSSAADATAVAVKVFIMPDY
jgi:hypothetical protein